MPGSRHGWPPSSSGLQPLSWHHGNLRSSLLDAALAALEQGGVEALSFRAIARATGVSQTAPYNHFDNREALLAELAENGFADLVASQATAAGTAGDSEQRLVALGLDYIAFARRHPQLYRLMFGAGLPGWHERPRVAAAKWGSIQPVRSVLADMGMTRNWIESDIDAAALAAWSLVHGLAMLRIDRAFFHFADSLDDDDIERRALSVGAWL